jgi:hypothetical protein
LASPIRLVAEKLILARQLLHRLNIAHSSVFFSVGPHSLFAPRFSAAGKTDSEANEVSVGVERGSTLPFCPALQRGRHLCCPFFQRR